MSNSNYPPGVSGHEPQIAGYDDDWDRDGEPPDEPDTPEESTKDTSASHKPEDCPNCEGGTLGFAGSCQCPCHKGQPLAWRPAARLSSDAPAPSPVANLAAQIARQGVTPAELPEGAPRDRLAALIAEGRTVHLYRHGLGALVIEITPAAPWHDPRWTPAAWCAYIRGEHSQDSGAPCMCAPCIEARQAAAWARYAAREQE